MTARFFEARAKLASDERGTVVVVFALMFVFLAFTAGIAIDYGRIVHTNSRIAAAADAAAIAAGRAMLDGRMSDAEIEAVAREYFNQNLSAGGTFGHIDRVAVAFNRSAGTVTIKVDAGVPTTLTRIAGFDDATLPVTSAAIFEQKDIELAMALDITGSMGSPSSKIADLRTAAKDLVDILLPDGGTPNRVRIGLAPYAASLNAGPYAGTVSGGASTGGCVHERRGGERFTDAAPAPGAYLGFTPAMNCPSAAVEPLTPDKALLKQRIDGYRAAGSTAGHIGTAWAWYLLSPDWTAIWPSPSAPVPYGDERTVKAVILMTDGEFNTEYVRSNGSSAVQAKSLCANMKAQGVLVYAVGFMSPSTAQALLKECASSPDHYFSASDGEELKGAFQAIAMNLNNLRLTQ
ncbi:MAG TPA: VWA domain-containing protein [Hyphomicrobiaceae bacterium]|nr:VWA domain-containing protein [Hyphomicrobiaceae bacterium]